MRKWIIFTVVYLACVVAVMNQFKVPPVMGASSWASSAWIRSSAAC
jgi:hypothetical protein